MKFEYDSRYYLKTSMPRHPLISKNLYTRGQVFGFVLEELAENSFSNLVLCKGQQLFDCVNIRTGSNIEIRSYGAGTKRLDLRQAKMQGIRRSVDMSEHIKKNRDQDGYLVGIRKDYDDNNLHILIGFIPSEYVLQTKKLEMKLEELYDMFDIDDATFDELSNKFHNKRHQLYRLR